LATKRGRNLSKTPKTPLSLSETCSARSELGFDASTTQLEPFISRFSELKPSDHPIKGSSAPIIEDPQTGLPAYKVSILVPAPKPLTPAPSTLTSRAVTPAVSKAPTPRSEPIPQERLINVEEVTTIFLKSLLATAEGFLGEAVEGVVVTVPSWWNASAREALERCLQNAQDGVKVLQLLDEAGAASVLFGEPGESASATDMVDRDVDPSIPVDRNTLIVDVGSSSLTLTLLSLRAGLPFLIASSCSPGLAGDKVDDRMIAYFAKEFTKKTKVPLTLGEQATEADRRAEAKLRLALEFTKRTLSASVGSTGGSSAASCSVESLKEGMDFNSSINRLRFDLEMRVVYAAILSKIDDLLKESGKERETVDELVFIGGTGSLPGLKEAVALSFPETIRVGRYGEDGGGGNEVLAKGAAYQAKLIAAALPDAEIEALSSAFKCSTNLIHASATAKNLVVAFVDANGKQLVPVILSDTPIPVRRSVQVEVDIPSTGSNKEEEFTLALEVWEAIDEVVVEKIQPPPREKTEDDQEEEEEEEEEPEEVRTKNLKAEKHLASFTARVSGSGRSKVWLEMHLEKTGPLRVSAWQPGWDEGKGSIEISQS
jgi:heat shock protein 1/8